MAKLVLMNSNESGPRKKVRDLKRGHCFTIKRKGEQQIFMRTDEAEMPVVIIGCSDETWVTGTLGMSVYLDEEVEHDLGIPQFKIEV